MIRTDLIRFGLGSFGIGQLLKEFLCSQLETWLPEGKGNLLIPFGRISDLPVLRPLP